MNERMNNDTYMYIILYTPRPILKRIQKAGQDLYEINLHWV